MPNVKSITICMHIINLTFYGRLFTWRPIFQSCLVNLKDNLLLYDCIMFELHNLCRLEKIKTNNISPRISDQQLRHFWNYWGVGKGHFLTGLRIPLFIFNPIKPGLFSRLPGLGGLRGPDTKNQSYHQPI